MRIRQIRHGNVSRAYLDHFDLIEGYLLSFDFRRTKQPGVERVRVGERVLWEGTV